MASSLDLARTYTSYSGVDIRVVINGKPAGSMQALSYAIQREKAPIYVMGSVDPVSYSRGKRGIAGTMISLMMDTHFLMSESFKNEKYLGDTDEIFASVDDSAGDDTDQQTVASLNNLQGGVTLKDLGGKKVESTVANLTGGGRRIGRNTTYNATELAENYKLASVFYVDQILPFDITIAAANEYGQAAQMRLYGCEILNEGSGFSIDDIVIENQMTYVCRTILPWRSFALKAKNAEQGGDAVDVRKELYNTTAGNRTGTPGSYAN